MNEQSFVDELIGRQQLKRVGAAYLAGPCPLCGGRDRFTLKLNGQNRWVWHCRKCSNEGWQSMLYLCYKLTGSWGYEEKNKKPKKPAAVSSFEAKKTMRLPAREYRNKLVDMVYEATILLYKEEGRPVKEYLLARRISEGSMYRHLLGARKLNGRLAVVIPSFEESGEIYSLKHRFIQGEPRYSYEKLEGYTAPMWGLHLLNCGKTLFAVEGEVNAISISQVAAELGIGLAVLSTGSQNWQQHLEFLRTIRKNYRRVLVWFDEEKIANEVGRELGANKVIKSPMVNGEKLDANAMLQKGMLAALLQDLL